MSEFIGLSVSQVMDLDVVEYLAVRRDAFVSEMSQSDKGREYLQNARMFETEDADYDAVEELRQILGGEG